MPNNLNAYYLIFTEACSTLDILPDQEFIMADQSTPQNTVKKATKKTASRTPAKKATKKTTKQVVAKRSTSTATASHLDAGKKVLASGLSAAKAYASVGKEIGGRALRSAGEGTKKYSQLAVREVKKNPKVASAVAAGLVSVGAALLVRKINRQSPQLGTRLADKANRATSALASQAAEVTHQIAARLKR
jgi:hypothetical protein